MKLLSFSAISLLAILGGCSARVETSASKGTTATVGATTGSSTASTGTGSTTAAVASAVKCPVCPTGVTAAAAAKAAKRVKKIDDATYVKIAKSAPAREKIKTNAIKVAEKSKEAVKKYDRLIILAKEKAKKNPKAARNAWYSYSGIQKLNRAKRVAQKQAAEATSFATRISSIRDDNEASIAAAQEEYDNYYYTNLEYDEICDELETELPKTDSDVPEVANLASGLDEESSFEITTYEETTETQGTEGNDNSDADEEESDEHGAANQAGPVVGSEGNETSTTTESSTHEESTESSTHESNEAGDDADDNDTADDNDDADNSAGDDNNADADDADASDNSSDSVEEHHEEEHEEVQGDTSDDDDN